MVTERDLLLDIIMNAPENSVWNISEDSWEKIPEVFPELKLSNHDYGWEIIINPKNRGRLLEVIDKHEIYEKIVHQQILGDGDTIFESFDHMSGSYIKSNFPCFKDLMVKYKDLELVELKTSQ